MNGEQGTRRGCETGQVGIFDIPRDVMVCIFHELDVEDLQHSRQVCSVWKSVLDENCASLWLTQCERRGLLPDTKDSVLGCSAQELRQRAWPLRKLVCDSPSSHAVLIENEQLANLYREYYFKCMHQLDTWQDGAHPSTEASKLQWTSESTVRMVLRFIGVRPSTDDLKSLVRSVQTPPKFRLPNTSRTSDGRVYRFDDLLRILAKKHSSGFSQQISESLSRFVVR